MRGDPFNDDFQFKFLCLKQFLFCVLVDKTNRQIGFSPSLTSKNILSVSTQYSGIISVSTQYSGIGADKIALLDLFGHALKVKVSCPLQL